MQIKLVNENFEEIDKNNSSIVCLNTSTSISSWILDYYFTEKVVRRKHFIGMNEMFDIFQLINRSLSVSEFFDLYQKKLKQRKNEISIENYDKYLKEYDLVDIIDIFHQCQFDSLNKTIILSRNNIKNNFDQLFFEYLLELSSTPIDDIKTEITTNEDQFDDTIASVEDNLKYTICAYLSLLSDPHNQYALIHCLSISDQIVCKHQTLTELNKLVNKFKNEDLNEQSMAILGQCYTGTKAFFDFIKQLRKTLDEHENMTSEPISIFHELLESVAKYLEKDECDTILKEIIDGFCQSFQTIFSLMSSTLPSHSASPEANLTNHHFLQSIAYLCAQQTINLPLCINNNALLRLTSSSVMTDEVKDVPVVNQSKTIKKSRSLDLSTIHETSFESDSIVNNDIDDSDKKISVQSTTKRQPLKEIDVNSFNNEERKIEYEQKFDQNLIKFTLASDGDKENLPILTRKRAMISTKNDPPSKKQKKTNVQVSDIDQKNDK